MFFAFCLVAAVLAVITGGNLNNLASLDIKRFSWIFASLVIRFVSEAASIEVSETAVIWSAALFAACYGSLFYGLAANLRTPGIPLVAAGSLLNFAVILLNSFRMPVSLNAFDAGVRSREAARLAASLTHTVLDSSTRLPFLADIFQWNYFSASPSMLSVGDFVIAAGAGWLLYRASKPRFFS